MCNTIVKLLDKDLFPWIDDEFSITDGDLEKASIVIADRLCGAVSDPIIRNAQEQRQLECIKAWLISNGYIYQKPECKSIKDMKPGTFVFRHNVEAFVGELGEDGSSEKTVNIPVDVLVKRKDTSYSYPLFIEAKSAGDFTNTNKRRKEEAQKVAQLNSTFEKDNVDFILFLSGYFDAGYLGYEAAEGIDWVWEHRVSDLKKAGL